ncbi:MAG: recombination mediator RecR [Thermoleophilaceae bacterium]
MQDSSFAPPINRLITELARFPGIGQRTAQRLAFHILRTPDQEALALAEAIREVKATVGECEVCFNLATEATCRICQDDRRDGHVLCVVEEPSDVIPLERTNEFSGRYHVLGGALSPIDGIDPEDLHITELFERAADNGVREVVVATNATTTGEATALYIADELHQKSPQVTVSRLASGLPVGSDLEYADEITLGRALRSRREL